MSENQKEKPKAKTPSTGEAAVEALGDTRKKAAIKQVGSKEFNRYVESAVKIAVAANPAGGKIAVALAVLRIVRKLCWKAKKSDYEILLNPK